MTITADTYLENYHLEVELGQDDQFTTYRGSRKSDVAPVIIQVIAPLYTGDELIRLGLTPYEEGDQCVAAILQADHAEYADLGPDDLPGVEVMYDGRRVLAGKIWAETGVRFLRLGTA